jgi:hypothetical protein
MSLAARSGYMRFSKDNKAEDIVIYSFVNYNTLKKG